MVVSNVFFIPNVLDIVSVIVRVATVIFLTYYNNESKFLSVSPSCFKQYFVFKQIQFFSLLID